MKNYIGARVRHTRYGVGTVTERKDDSFVIHFENPSADKQMGFTAFGKMISFEDATCQKAILEEVAQGQAEKQELFEAERAKRWAKLEAEKAEEEAREAEATPRRRRAVRQPEPVGFALHENQVIADSAYRLFEDCCNAFGWDMTKYGAFCKQKSLHALNVTAEHYGIWCLANSNWNGRENGRWRNHISDDRNTICTEWLNADDPEFRKNEGTLVVFAKRKDNLYVFLGLYRCMRTDYEKHCKVYQRVSKEYRPYASLTEEKVA